MISSAMGSAGLGASAGSVGGPMVPALVAGGPGLVEIGWVLAAFVAVFFGALLGIALGEYDVPEPAPRTRRVRVPHTASAAPASMTPAR